MPGPPVHHQSRSSPKLMSIKSVMPSSHLILCRPLLLLPSNESTLHMRWPKYWSFSFSIIPSKEHPGLISFRMDWLDLLAVQGTLKNLLQHHSSKASILRRSAFFIVHSVMSDSVQPQRRQPTRLPRPWDSPRKNTGVGCHFLLQCMQVKCESEVAQSCSTLRDPMDCSLPGSSVHGILQARILGWVTIFYSRGSFRPRDRNCVTCFSYLAGGFFTTAPPG